jgi:hypothetical protein
LAAEMLDRQAPSVFHLELREGGKCSFCLRPDRKDTIVAAGEVGMCSECVGSVPFAS